MSLTSALKSMKIGKVAVASLAVGALLAGSATAQLRHVADHHEERNYDARIEVNQRFAPTKAATFQVDALEAMQSHVGDLKFYIDPDFGVTRTVYNMMGYLSDPLKGASHSMEGSAMDFVRANLAALGLQQEDLAEYQMTDNVFNKVTGATHIYWQQMHAGIPVYNGQLHVNINRDGRIISVNNLFVPGIANGVNSPDPKLAAAAAVESAAGHLGVDLGTPLKAAAVVDGVTTIEAPALSLEKIDARLVWVPINSRELRLAWNFQVQTTDSEHWYDMTVDAETGQVWTRFDWVHSGTYRVYEQPVEDPNDASPLPPSDGRTLVVNPENGTASPNGWFSGGTMDGNNVHACPDVNANNVCDSNPQCAGTTCDFANNLSGQPVTYQAAAVANLFYWNNIIHDIQYQYGFDEAGGNFQENNFGNGGAGSDSVNADAQDTSFPSPCNANFSTPPDGSNPRMQMFLCDNTTPDVDGDYDNGVIVHEYGHGISIRQVGGPANSGCLNNNQQPGEGWSDWFGLVYTARASHTGALPRGLGAYLFNVPVTIRDLPYSTDSSVNNHTYASIAGAAIPHGIGSRWAQGIWDVYWALVDKHGFDSNLYSATGGAGNTRALLYVNEGLKNTACSPTFLQARDGIIQAATDNFGGADVCDIWQAFADFGLGTNASTGGSNSTTATNGFNVPVACQCSPQPVADAGPDQTINPGDSVQIGTAAQAGTTYSWSPGGATTAQITVSPASTTVYTVTATTSCGSSQDSVTVNVSGPSSCPAGSIDFNSFALTSYSNQNVSNNTAVQDGGDTLQLTGNTWVRGTGTFNITSNTVIEFEYASDVQGEIHAIGFDADDTLNDEPAHFQIWGTQNWTGTGNVGRTAQQYSGGGSFQTFTIPVGQTYTGNRRLVFTNDKDSGTLNNNGRFKCVRIFEDTGGPGGECAVDDDMEANTDNWIIGASTCTTGTYVDGNPTQQTTSGVVTQPNGSASGVHSIFTATNISAGNADVDGGECVVETINPYNAAAASTLSVDYFHGQRDTGDDPGDDYMFIEYSVNGGAWQTVFTNGDTRSVASWTTVTAQVPAGNIDVRVRCSDGAGPGDIVECGIDNLSICEN